MLMSGADFLIGILIFAIIVGSAAILCCFLLVSVSRERVDRIAAISDSWRKSQFELALLVEERRTKTAIQVARLAQPPQLANRRQESITRTSESALLALLAANGGFLGGPGDKAIRQIVREVREMYAEIDNPTVVAESEKVKVYAGAGEEVDDLTLDEVFAAEPVDEDEDL